MFNRDTVGVFTSLTLFGAGVGLLVGSYLASLLISPFDEEFEEDFNTPEVDDNGSDKTNNQAEDNSEEKSGGKERAASGPTHVAGREDGEVSGGEAGHPADGVSKRTALGPTHTVVRIDAELREEINRLVRTYQIDNDEVEILQEGLMTPAELEAEILQENAPVIEYDMDKPDLDELVPVLEDEFDANNITFPSVSGNNVRFLVLTQDPRKDDVKKVYKFIELWYATETDILYRKMRGGEKSEVNPDTIGENNIDAILGLLIHSEEDEIVYIYDNETKRAYSVQLDVGGG